MFVNNPRSFTDKNILENSYYHSGSTELLLLIKSFCWKEAIVYSQSWTCGKYFTKYVVIVVGILQNISIIVLPSQNLKCKVFNNFASGCNFFLCLKLWEAPTQFFSTNSQSGKLHFQNLIFPSLIAPFSLLYLELDWKAALSAELSCQKYFLGHAVEGQLNTLSICTWFFKISISQNWFLKLIFCLFQTFCRLHRQ